MIDERMSAREALALAEDLSEVAAEMESSAAEERPTNTTSVTPSPNHRIRLTYIEERLVGLIDYLNKRNIW